MTHHSDSGGDPAGWAKASCQHERAADSLRDHIRQGLSAARYGDKPLAAAAVAMIVDHVLDVIEAGAREGWLLDSIEHMDGGGIPQRHLEAISTIIGDIISSRNPRLAAQVYDIAFGLGIQGGISATEVGHQHGVTRAAVSKRCRALVERFKIYPSRGMRSPRAVESSRRARLKYCADNKMQPQPSARELSEARNPRPKNQTGEAGR